MILALYVFLLFIGLLFAQEIFRRFPGFALFIFLISPVLLISYWISNGINDWFSLAKVFSVALGVIWLSIFRLTNIKENRFAKIVVYLLLLINILEAVVKDISGSNIVHYMNATSGILLIATLSKIDSISVTKDKYKDLNWGGMPLMWIIGYTIWNWTFVYLNFIYFAVLHIAVLGAPLAIAFIDRKRWVQTRAFTLGIYLLVFYSLLPSLNMGQYGHWDNEFAKYGFAGTSLIFMIIYTTIFMRFKLRVNRQK